MGYILIMSLNDSQIVRYNVTETWPPEGLQIKIRNLSKIK